MDGKAFVITGDAYWALRKVVYGEVEYTPRERVLRVTDSDGRVCYRG